MKIDSFSRNRQFKLTDRKRTATRGSQGDDIRGERKRRRERRYPGWKEEEQE